MSTDYKSVLEQIVRLSKRQKDNKISLTYLAQQSSYSIQELKIVIRLLEEEGYIATKHPMPKIILIQPTISGYEKAKEWEDLALAKTPKRRLLTLGKVVGASLLAVVLGIVWWWAGISNNTIEPLASTVAPFRIYDQWTSSILEGGGGPFYDAVNVSLQSGEISNPNGSITATLNGKFSLSFDVETNAQNHQVNIQSIDVQIVRDAPPSVTDIYQGFSGLGGGMVREFEVPFTATENLRVGGNIITHTQMLSNYDEPVDYIYLRPGEREMIRIIVNLAEPGRYKVTPILNYAFQEKISSQTAGTSVVYYPQDYRYWESIYNELTQTSDMFPSGNIILNTKSLTFQRPIPIPYSQVVCCNLDKWIAFVALVTQGDQRLFVSNTKTGTLEMLSGPEKNIHILGWDHFGNLYFTEETVDYKLRQSQIESRVWNSNSGVSPIDSSQIPKELFTSQNYDSKCIEDQNICLDVREQDTNGNGVVDDSDRQQVVLVDTNGNVVRRIGFSQRWQDSPVLSPDNTNLIYREGYGCTTSNLEKIFITDIYGNNLRELISFPSRNNTFSWLPNGQELAFASNRSYDESGNASCDDNAYQVYSINIQTGSVLTLTRDSRYDTIFGWSSDGKWLIVAGTNLALVDQNGNCLQVITPAFLDIRDPHGTKSVFIEAVMQP